MAVGGSCMCGAITFRVTGTLRDVINCHCHRCRKHTGHFMAATAARAADIDLSGEPPRWFAPIPEVEYGFCATCGSSLFWRSADRPAMWSIAAGTLDPPTGLRTTRALFVGAASDYHTLDQTLEQHEKDTE